MLFPFNLIMKLEVLLIEKHFPHFVVYHQSDSFSVHKLLSEYRYGCRQLIAKTHQNNFISSQFNHECFVTHATSDTREARSLLDLA